MPEGILLLAFVTAQRLCELWLARRNTAAQLVRGGIEFGAAHYPLIVALHTAWLAGLWLLGSDARVGRLALAAFIALQAVRLWVLFSLGPRWTTRIIVVPGDALVTRGPYRFLRHPNYVVVALEIAVVPLALGLPMYAAAFFALNLVALAIRIRAEKPALLEAENAPAKGPPTQPFPASQGELAKPARRR
jgi:methyltransferase